MFIPILILIAGFALLIKSAGILVDGSSSIARRYGISSIVIGLTIVAFGTSAPELVVNIISSAQGASEIAIGNILGSNIANILLILGVAAVITPLKVKKNTSRKEVPLAILAVIVLGVMANDFIIDGSGPSMLSRIDGIILLTFFIIFMYYTFGIAKVSGEETPVQSRKTWLSSIMVLGGIIGLTVGGKLVVDNAIAIATALHVSEALIGLTIVALGLSATINPLPFNTDMNFDLIFALVSSLILFIFIFNSKDQTIKRWEGIGLITIYVLYLVYLVIRG